jgi:hypothetical protein
VIGPDGKPLETQIPLVPGHSIDRYGSEYGSLLAPRSCRTRLAPSGRKALPGSRQAAACNYHLYR